MVFMKPTAVDVGESSSGRSLLTKKGNKFGESGGFWGMPTSVRIFLPLNFLRTRDVVFF